MLLGCRFLKLWLFSASNRFAFVMQKQTKPIGQVRERERTDRTPLVRLNKHIDHCWCAYIRRHPSQQIKRLSSSNCLPEYMYGSLGRCTDVEKVLNVRRDSLCEVRPVVIELELVEVDSLKHYLGSIVCVPHTF